MDMSNILKPALARGKIKVIGITTNNEFKKYLEPDKALIRRFPIVQIEEPSKEETMAILQGIKPELEKYYGVKIGNDAMVGAINLSVKYLQDKRLPDKAIDVLDQSTADVKIHLTTKPNEILLLEEKKQKSFFEKEMIAMEQNALSQKKITELQKQIDEIDGELI